MGTWHSVASSSSTVQADIARRFGSVDLLHVGTVQADIARRFGSVDLLHVGTQACRQTHNDPSLSPKFSYTRTASVTVISVAVEHAAVAAAADLIGLFIPVTWL